MKRPRLHLPFANATDERNQLADLIAYLEATGRARPGERAETLRRFRHLLEQIGPGDGSIRLQEHWGLLFEAEGDFAAAARHRDREARLTRRLFAIGGPVGPIDHQYFARGGPTCATTTSGPGTTRGPGSHGSGWRTPTARRGRSAGSDLTKAAPAAVATSLRAFAGRRPVGRIVNRPRVPLITAGL